MHFVSTCCRMFLPGILMHGMPFYMMRASHACTQRLQCYWHKIYEPQQLQTTDPQLLINITSTTEQNEHGEEPMQAKENFQNIAPLPQLQTTSPLATHDIQESSRSPPILQSASATSPRGRPVQTPCTTDSETCHTTPHTSSIFCGQNTFFR